MAQFILLLHSTPADWLSLDAAEMQAIIAKYRDWSQTLGAQGKLAGGYKLADGGVRHLHRRNGVVVAADGPYAEAKDAVGGLFVIEVADLAEAEAIAGTCPHLDGGWIELRPIEITGPSA
jgi:hypothetical protein